MLKLSSLSPFAYTYFLASAQLKSQSVMDEREFFNLNPCMPSRTFFFFAIQYFFDCCSDVILSLVSDTKCNNILSAVPL